VLSFLLKLEKDEKEKYVCPVDPQGCQDLETKYLRQSRFVISPDCLQTGIKGPSGEGHWDSVLNKWKQLREGP